MYINIIQTKYNYEEIPDIKMTKNIKVTTGSCTRNSD
jgi:hypothetical protein